MVARERTPRGELCLRRRGRHLEIISNGVFLMSTEGGVSERLLVDVALDARGPGADRGRLLLGGLGVGFSVARAVERDDLTAITVVEVEPAIVRWHLRHLAQRVGRPLDDPRVAVRVDDLVRWLSTPPTGRFDAICLDVDNGPEWTVTPDNAALYDDVALELWRTWLRPGGALAVWSAHPAPAFVARLWRRFADVAEHRVRAARGDDDRVYVAARPTS